MSPHSRCPLEGLHVAYLNGDHGRRRSGSHGTDECRGDAGSWSSTSSPSQDGSIKSVNNTFSSGNGYLNPGRSTLPRRLRPILSLDDFEQAARAFLPRPIFGYVSGAAEDNSSLAQNRSSFAERDFKTRVLVNVAERTQHVDLFGHRYASPFGISPMGLSALSAYRGDLVQAAAAHAANVPMILSGSSLITMEEVIAVNPSTWFQAYLPGDPNRIQALLNRVASAGYERLVLTVDLPVAGNRENNVRSGFSTPLRPSTRLALDGLTRPRWLIGTLLKTLIRHGMPHFENSFAERGAPILSSRVLRDFSARDHLNWDHVRAIRGSWSGPLILKGILSPEDSAMALGVGVDGIIVSNHAGRQLDGAVAPLRVLPQIKDAAGKMTVMLDSGIRRGTDVLKALALGADCTFVGRPFNYAAAVHGELGVAHAIGILRDEIDRNMAMLGMRNLGELSPACLVSR